MRTRPQVLTTRWPGRSGPMWQARGDDLSHWSGSGCQGAGMVEWCSETFPLMLRTAGPAAGRCALMMRPDPRASPIISSRLPGPC